MVNETFVRHFFADQKSVGRHFAWVLDRRRRHRNRRRHRGCAVPERQRRHETVVFTALLQDDSQFALDCELEVRTTGDPAAAAGQLRAALADVDRNLPLTDVKTLRDQVASTFAASGSRPARERLWRARARARVRRALRRGVASRGAPYERNRPSSRAGAQRNDVLWMILRDTLTLVVAGLVVGIPAAYAAGRLVASQLYG